MLPYLLAVPALVIGFLFVAGIGRLITLVLPILAMDDEPIGEKLFVYFIIAAIAIGFIFLIGAIIVLTGEAIAPLLN